MSRRRFKRVLDVTYTLLAAPVWVPLLALVALYQLLAAGRPLLFRQVRVGAGRSALRHDQVPHHAHRCGGGRTRTARERR
jgi:lipopolysaccharide/colanic/teichoic acid biosynthesis glycosyltransferase